MQWLSEVCYQDTHANVGAQDHTNYLAICVWCVDIVGPFKPVRGNMTHILVMVDKFTKWIEVKPIRKCDGATAVTFLKDIILRYGILTVS